VKKKLQLIINQKLRITVQSASPWGYFGTVIVELKERILKKILAIVFFRY